MPKLKFYCSRWGHEQVAWKSFAERVRQNSFSGVEVIALRYLDQIEDMLNQLESNGLEYNLIYTQKDADYDFDRYLGNLKKDILEIATTYRRGNTIPKYIITQLGREYYTMEQMAKCFEVCEGVTSETDIQIIHETHRYRWSYAAHVVKDYLKQFPNIKLTLDLSHWFCVSESYLTDQQEAIDLALDRTVHLHARVGHTQGPQVTDPRSPENAEAMAHHLKWWDKWIALQAEKGIEECTITPEFGPKPYMMHSPKSNLPIADLWEVNHWMMDFLKSRYNK